MLSAPMKTMEGAISSATRKSSRTSLGPSPRYFWMSSDPTTGARSRRATLFVPASGNWDKGVDYRQLG